MHLSLEHHSTSQSDSEAVECPQFGKKAVNGTQDRTALFTETYNELLTSLQTGGSYRGALFWQWNNDQGTGDNTLIMNGDATYL